MSEISVDVLNRAEKQLKLLNTLLKEIMDFIERTDARGETYADNQELCRDAVSTMSQLIDIIRNFRGPTNDGKTTTNPRGTAQA